MTDWAVLLALAGALVAADLVASRRAAPGTRVRRSLLSLAACVAAGVGYGLYLWQRRGPDPAQRYLAGYLTEAGLSLDNLLVFVLVFERFGTPPEQRRRVLFWGILGAVLLRTALIAAGARAVHQFHWLLPLMGALIVSSAVRLALAGPGPRSGSDPADPAARGPVRALLRRLPLSDRCDGNRFFTREAGRRLATPLLATLLIIEAADLLFAFDSIPAVIGITRDSFLAAASNILAIVGLRSAYFVVADALPRLRGLRPGLALLLLFVGLRLLLDPWIRIPASAALLVIGAIIAASLALSIMRGGGPSSRRPQSAVNGRRPCAASPPPSSEG